MPSGLKEFRILALNFLYNFQGVPLIFRDTNVNGEFVFHTQLLSSDILSYHVSVQAASSSSLVS